MTKEGYKDLPTVRLAYQGFDIQHFTNLVIADERHRVLADERAALAQQDAESHLQAVSDFGQLQKQEPVELETIYEAIVHWDEGGGKRSRRELARRIVDLYTSAPQRQPLTSQQLIDLEINLRKYSGKDGYDLSLSEFARTIELHHGIGDKT